MLIADTVVVLCVCIYGGLHDDTDSQTCTVAVESLFTAKFTAENSEIIFI